MSGPATARLLDLVRQALDDDFRPADDPVLQTTARAELRRLDPP